MGGLSLRSSALLVPLALFAGSCVAAPEPGEYGLIRYAGNVRGNTPLPLLPPLSDRNGNAYVLFGARDRTQEVTLFVGHAGAGWSGGCNLIGGIEHGLFGWVGRAQDRAWYWAGDALVQAVGRTGSCSRVLELDPTSGARLSFRAVVPWVLDTPSRTRALAWIQSPTDPVPFQVVIDLNSSVYTTANAFEPAFAQDVTVLGVGGRVNEGEGVVVVRYFDGQALRVEARFLDVDAATTDETALAGLETLPAYGIVGYLQANDAGLYAGLDVEKQLVVLDRSGGARRPVTVMDPIGVHRWQGVLFLVGLAGDRPAIAAIDDDGGLGKVQTWSSSVAANNLGSKIELIDDRSLPSNRITWNNPRNAMGPFPFLHEHTLDHYAGDTTTWLLAGPSFEVGGEARTAIAYAPVGITYP